MAIASLPARVDRLEEGMVELQRIVAETSRKVAETTENVNRLSLEMQEFKDEMQEFKDEMQEAEARSEREHKRFRQELATITHNMGRLAEDLVAPSMPSIIAQVFPCDEPPQMLGVRIRRHAEGRSKEYDVLTLCGDSLLITEVKSRLRPGDIDDFLAALPESRTFLPEYADKQMIGALASFYVDESQVRQAERQGLLVLGVIDGLMQVLNQPDFSPRRF